MYIARHAAGPLRSLAESPVGRCVILTGARQTGKSTLVRREFTPQYEYHTFDEALARDRLARTPAAEWLARGRCYAFDEVQKVPPFLGTVKVVLDEGPDSMRLILTGSAQILLLQSVRETLAGRVTVREIFPLTLAELAGGGPPLFATLAGCSSREHVAGLLREAAMAPERRRAAAEARPLLDALMSHGGMPALTRLEAEEHRWIWLEEYVSTYLQRDVADLGRVADLDDFLRLERLAATRCATSLNYADLARDADLAPITAKKYVRYLELSYQAFLLPAFRGRRGSRLVKAPRLHWLDLGVQRVLSGQRQGLTGPQLETAVVGELHKCARTLRLHVELSYLRTKDGREVDLLARLPSGGYLAMEVKLGERASHADTRHMRGLSDLLDGPLLAGLLLYRGRSVEALGDGMWAVPAEMLLSPWT